MKKLYPLITITAVIAFAQSCYYDVEETLYPAACDTCSTCITTGLTYDVDIQNIISANCLGCHSGAAPAGESGFESRLQLVSVINDPGSNFICRINWSSGCNRMPESGSKLSDCSILKLETWIGDGMP